MALLGQEALEFFADGVVTHWRECRRGRFPLSKAKWAPNLDPQQG